MNTAQLDQEAVRDLAKSPGPCVSIFLPPLVRRDQTASGTRALLKNLTEEAAAALAARNLDRTAIGDLIDPIKQLSEDPDWLQGYRWSRAIFRSPATFQGFDMHGPVDARFSASDRFDLLSIVPELEFPREFLVLKLSKKRAALLRGPEMKPVPLTGRVPETLDEFLALDIPDHDRENRAPIRAGGGRRIRFSTGSERETQQSHLHDFYRAIDRAVSELVNARRPPLLVAGVDEDTSLYHSLSAYPNLLAKPIQGSPDNGVSCHDLLDRAQAALREHAVDTAAAALIEAKERLAPSRFLTDRDAISRLACEGRIAQLFARADAEDFHGRLNADAVETIIHGGSVSVLPPDRMPNFTAAAALRY